MSGAVQRYLAVDLGASSGRVLVGSFDGETVRVDTVHRFANTPLRLPDGLHWDLGLLYKGVVDGMRAAATRYGSHFDGIGVDSWAVDYA